ncbi:hypothetical protein ABTM64_20270, partial [Acinetobacter baumannii]
GGFFVHPLFRAFSNDADVSGDAYQAAIAARGQKIIDGRTKTQLARSTPDGQRVMLTDTVQGFTVPIRSRQDDDYLRALLAAQIVDIDFIK